MPATGFLVLCGCTIKICTAYKASKRRGDDWDLVAMKNKVARRMSVTRSVSSLNKSSSAKIYIAPRGGSDSEVRVIGEREI